jgi:glycosyltransferase involved in cell wall biosynthesis
MAKEVRASVIHCNTSAVLVGAILGRPAGSRLVWHVHEIVTTPPHLALVLRTAPVLAADRVIVVSDAAGRHLIAPGRLRQKVRTVYNGLPDHEPPRSGRTPRSEGPVEIAFVGRLNRWKGPEVLVDALALLRPRAGAVHCTIAGDPPPGESWRAGALRAQAERLGVESRVEFAGLVEEGWRVFWNADIAVVPSTYPEPFGLTTIEAMQASCAVITTSHGAGPELIVDGESGLLVPPRDAAALAAAIDRLLDDPGLIDRLGAAGRARALQLFGVEAMVDGVVAVYRSLLP